MTTLMLVGYYEWMPFKSNVIFEVTNDKKESGAAQLCRLFADRFKAHQIVFLVCKYFPLQKEDGHSLFKRRHVLMWETFWVLKWS